MTQIDGLRAVAALLVVAFHYTTRYDAVFVHTSALPFGIPLGYLGVQLFFVISGFVIFMTIDASRSPTDFVVSRVSRLYPAYWFAVIVSWLALYVSELPGLVRSPFELLANLTMIHGFFGIESVDGVYWSLAVELTFYVWMLLLWVTGALKRPVLVLACATGLSTLAAIAPVAFGVSVPYVVATFLLLDWSPWFCIGMLVYLLSRDRIGMNSFILLWLGASAAILAKSGALHVAVAAVSTILVLAACRGRLNWAGVRPLVAIGAFSYPLYLIHEKLGWIAILRLESAGVAPIYAILIVVTAVLAMAYLVHRAIEVPAMTWIRAAYRRARSSGSGPQGARRGTLWAAGSLATLVVLALGLRIGEAVLPQRHPTPPTVAAVDPARHPEVPCADKTGRPGLVLLVLGQSNAASHASAPSTKPVTVFGGGGRCVSSADPLPGTTGHGASLWTELGTLLVRDVPERTVIFAPYAVGGTRISDWIDGGPTASGLRAYLDALRRSGMTVSAVLWQQGEADMLAGTEAARYIDGLVRLRTQLTSQGVEAPMFVARSTRCFIDGSGAIGRALDRAGPRLERLGILPGPDTDRLDGTSRSDRCHFSAAGRERAAALWYETLKEAEANRRR